MVFEKENHKGSKPFNIDYQRKNSVRIVIQSQPAYESCDKASFVLP